MDKNSLNKRYGERQSATHHYGDSVFTTNQDLLMDSSNEADETPTLADPMTLVGAKHLLPPPHHSSIIHHHSPSRHHQHHIHHPLLPISSPSPPILSHHSPLMPSPLHHQSSPSIIAHHTPSPSELWQQQSADNSDEGEEGEFPSTVDIHAIRDSPSSSPCGNNQLTTIDINWESPNDSQQAGSSMQVETRTSASNHQQADNEDSNRESDGSADDSDEASDDYDSADSDEMEHLNGKEQENKIARNPGKERALNFDTERNENSGNNSFAAKSYSQVKSKAGGESTKGRKLQSSSKEERNNSDSDSDDSDSDSSKSSGSSAESKSDSDGNSSDSNSSSKSNANDSSGNEDNNSSSSSSNSSEDEEENKNKPLPRRKPQLVVPELRRSNDVVRKTLASCSSSNEESSDSNVSRRSNSSNLAQSDTKLSSGEHEKGSSEVASSSQSSDKYNDGAKATYLNVMKLSPSKSSSKSACDSVGDKFAVPKSIRTTEKKHLNSRKKRDSEVLFDKLLSKSSSSTGPITDENDMPILIGRGRRKFKPLLPYKIDPDEQEENSKSFSNRQENVATSVMKSTSSDKLLSPRKNTQSHSALSVRPTIADLVKVRERRKSFDRDTSSGSEFEKRKSLVGSNKKHSKSSRNNKQSLSRKLSQSSIESNSSYLSESEQISNKLDVATDSSADSVTLDDNAEPGTPALPQIEPFNFLPSANSSIKSLSQGKALPKPPPNNSSPKKLHSISPPNKSPCKQSSLPRKQTVSKESAVKERPRKCCYKDYSSSDSDESSLSDGNIQVNLDSEQTQTFSLNENNLNQGRLTMTIAALKMSKFGPSVIREVGSSLVPLPTRATHISPPICRSTPTVGPSSEEDNSCSSSGGSGCCAKGGKVKTAAERKTYVDVNPIVNSRRKVSSHRSNSTPLGGEDEDEGLSRLAHHLSQMGENAQLGSGRLEELDQDVLEALLPEVSSHASNSHEDRHGGEEVKSLNDRMLKKKACRKSDHQTMDEDRSSSNNLQPPILEPFMPLDCSVSNVSPDSGIQSVNGSPLHQLMASPHRGSPLHLTPKYSEQSTNPMASGYSPCSSPPPPILHPAVTSPLTIDDINPPPSPEMPVLKCQVSPPPPWLLLHDKHHQSPTKVINQENSVRQELCIVSSNETIDISTQQTIHHSPREQINHSVQEHIQISPQKPLNISPPETTYVHESMDVSPQEPIRISPVEPINISLQKSGSVSHQEPISVFSQEPINISPKEPVTISHQEPIPISHQEPIPISHQEPITISHQDPITVSHQEPITVSHQKPITVSPQEPITVSPQEPITVSPQEPISNYPQEPISVSNQEPISVSNQEPIGVSNQEPIRVSPREPNSVPSEESIRTSQKSTSISPQKLLLVESNVVQKQLPMVLADSAEEVNSKKPRGRPKGSKNKRTNLDNLQIENDIRSFKDQLETNFPQPHSPKPDPLFNQPAHSFNQHESPKVKRSVGRPRKFPKCTTPSIPDITNKTFSDQIVHKIINEKVKNSEKSDKLSVRMKEDEGGGGNVVGSSSQSIPKTNKVSRRPGRPSDGIPLEERKKKRGRKKELPAIFRKVYGPLAIEKGSTKTKDSMSSPLSSISSNSKTIHKKKKKKVKHFKSKHKNIIDPAFLNLLEELLVQMEGCTISKNKPEKMIVGNEYNSSTLPPVFRVKKLSALSSITGKKRRTAADKKASDKESGTETESSISKEKNLSKRKKKLQEIPKQGREKNSAETAANIEQRLPLKKRHRHISTAVPTEHTPSVTMAFADTCNGCTSTTNSSGLKLDGLSPLVEENTSKKADEKLVPNTTVQKVIYHRPFLDDEMYTPVRNAESKSLKCGISCVNSIEIETLTKTSTERSRNVTSIQPSLSSTTPKKRHRLEAEMKGESINDVQDTNLETNTLSPSKKSISKTSQLRNVRKKVNDNFNEKPVTSNISVMENEHHKLAAYGASQSNSSSPIPNEFIRETRSSSGVLSKTPSPTISPKKSPNKKKPEISSDESSPYKYKRRKNQSYSESHNLEPSATISEFFESPKKKFESQSVISDLAKLVGSYTNKQLGITTSISHSRSYEPEPKFVPEVSRSERQVLRSELLSTRSELLSTRSELPDLKFESDRTESGCVETDSGHVAFRAEQSESKSDYSKFKSERLASRSVRLSSRSERPTTRIERPLSRSDRLESRYEKSVQIEYTHGSLESESSQFRSDRFQIRFDQTEAKSVRPKSRSDRKEFSPERTEYTSDKPQSKPERLESRSEIPEPRSEILKSRHEIAEPRSEITESRSEITESKSEITESKSEITESKSEITESKSEITESKSGRPASRTEYPASTSERPASRTERPASRTERPASRTERLESRAERLESKTERPASRTERPASRTERLESRTERLESRSERPASRSERLESRSERLESRSERLESRSERPASRSERVESRSERLESRSKRAESQIDKQLCRSEVSTALVDRPDSNSVMRESSVVNSEDSFKNTDSVKAESRKGIHGYNDRLDSITSRFDSRITRSDLKAKIRPESRASSIKSCDSMSKPGTPDLIADTNISPDKIAQDIIITDGILERGAGVDLLDCKVDLYPVDEKYLTQCNTKSHSFLKKSSSDCDSDVSSEHHPLGESDQSGFMSDKEEYKEVAPLKKVQKRLKKKRELRSPAKQRSLEVEKVLNKVPASLPPVEEEDNKDNLLPPVKKKTKRRRLNRTGFPTIKKKKRKLKTDEGIALTNKEETTVLKDESKSNLRHGELSETMADTTSSLNTVDASLSPVLKTPSTIVTSTDVLNVAEFDVNNEIERDLDASTTLSKPRGRGRPKKLKTEEINTSENEVDLSEMPLIKPSKVRERKHQKPQRNENAASIAASEEMNAKTSSLVDADVKQIVPGVECSSVTDLPLVPKGPTTIFTVLDDILNDERANISCRTRKKRELTLEESSGEPTTDNKRRKLNTFTSTINSVVESAKNTASACDVNQSSVFPSQNNSCTVSSEAASGDEGNRLTTAKKKIPRWKKKYLSAGLFSDYYKQDDPQTSSKKNGELHYMSKANQLKVDEFNQSSSGPVLPIPNYCRKFLFETEQDFNLPYDLWWLYTNNLLPGRDLVPSWNYKKIKSNLFFDVKPSHCAAETQACNCRRPTNPESEGCADDCINRMMFIECTAQTCPITDRCSNQRIQKHQYLTCLMRFMTQNKGWGVKITEPIKTGTFILEYVGEVVSEKEFKRRMQTTYVNDTHHYCLNLDRGMVIDGHRMGGDCRFVNHSCEPNCEMQKWGVNGQYRMALYAKIDIEAGTELTYDYNFSLFNPTEGQVCKCGSENCRGVIGGRSQRVTVSSALAIDSNKRKATSKKDMTMRKKRRTNGTCSSIDSDVSTGSSKNSCNIALLKALSPQQRAFILLHRVFLIRNLTKLKRSKDRLTISTKVPEKCWETKTGNVLNPNTGGTPTEATTAAEPVDEFEQEDDRVVNFLTHFTALNTARSVRTRRLVQAEDDPEMSQLAKLAQIFKDIYDKLVASRDPIEDKPLASPFMSLPSKKKHPNYYTRVGEPVDLYTIERNILTGQYKNPESFDVDVMRLFHNNLRYFGRNTPVGKLAVGLKKVYNECKLQFKPLLEEVLGPDGLPAPFAVATNNEDTESDSEDIIRCVCNMPRDEGLMIQCEKCLVWQHFDCMGVKTKHADQEDDPPYHCEECVPRRVSPEVPMTPQPADAPPTDKYFITLLRDNLQVKQGDSVYILKDRPTHKPGERHQPAYRTAKDLKTHDLLIFKIENLWIDEKGDKFAFGHHYLRPHETFHEPWRKFFPNEVIRSPICDILALDMIVGHCWVLDLNTYCRGRPIEAQEEHVYVCEYRVDKGARIFSKISKPKYPICTKSYAFVAYPTKMKPLRTYTPHEVIYSGRNKSSSTNNNNKSTKDSNSALTKVKASRSRTNSPVCSGKTSRSSSSNADHEANDASDSTISNKLSVQNVKISKQTRVNLVATRLLSKFGGPAEGGKDGGNLDELIGKLTPFEKKPQRPGRPKKIRTFGDANLCSNGKQTDVIKNVVAPKRKYNKKRGNSDVDKERGSTDTMSVNINSTCSSNSSCDAANDSLNGRKKKRVIRSPSDSNVDEVDGKMKAKSPGESTERPENVEASVSKSPKVKLNDKHTKDSETNKPSDLESESTLKPSETDGDKNADGRKEPEDVKAEEKSVLPPNRSEIKEANPSTSVDNERNNPTVNDEVQDSSVISSDNKDKKQTAGISKVCNSKDISTNKLNVIDNKPKYKSPIKTSPPKLKRNLHLNLYSGDPISAPKIENTQSKNLQPNVKSDAGATKTADETNSLISEATKPSTEIANNAKTLNSNQTERNSTTGTKDLVAANNKHTEVDSPTHTARKMMENSNTESNITAMQQTQPINLSDKKEKAGNSTESSKALECDTQSVSSETVPESKTSTFRSSNSSMTDSKVLESGPESSKDSLSDSTNI